MRRGTRFKRKTISESPAIRLNGLDRSLNDINVIVGGGRVKTNRQNVLCQTLELTVTTDDVNTKPT